MHGFSVLSSAYIFYKHKQQSKMKKKPHDLTSEIFPDFKEVSDG